MSRDHAALKAQPCDLEKALIQIADAADLPRQADFSDGRQIGAQRPIQIAGGDGKCCCQVCGRLLQTEAAHNIDVGVTAAHRDPTPLFQHADYLRNITNEAHRAVYEDFGATEIEYGLDKTENYAGKALMTCKYCLRYELGWCKKNPTVSNAPKDPLYLISSKHRFRLEFDCGKCEMRISC